MIDWLGWAATAVFLASYGCKDQKRLRLVQATAALLWTSYGMLIGAVPIIVANLLVAAAAFYSTFQRGPRRPAVRPGSELDLSRTSSPYN
jgi:Bacterial inner membrane protein